MTDPSALGAAGVVALTEGIKFLYGQAGEALKRWRERKTSATRPPQPPAESIQVTLPTDAFEGQLERPQLDLEAVERLEVDLRDLRSAVADYAQGIDEVDPRDRRLLETVDALRRAMEAVYGQRITFKGEPGPPSGLVVVGEAQVDQVSGYVAGLRARRIIGGSVTGRVESEEVGPEGQAVGVEVDTVGPSTPGEASGG